MHKLEVTLKQHTPLIHFQHSQDGATLRATEVKPKLDKFILKKFDHYSASEDLKYKMRIVSEGKKTEYIIASRLDKKKKKLLMDEGYFVIQASTYFAQEKEYGELFDWEDTNNRQLGYKFKNDYKERLKNLSKKGVKYKTTKLFINSFDETLIQQIISILPEFFVAENFGTRNGKGFGSYTVISLNINDKPQDFEPKIDEWLKNNYDFVYKKDLMGQLPYMIILKDYKLMKSGYSELEWNEGYAKSLLFHYFAERNVRWEKRWFKQQIMPFTTPGNPFSGYKLKGSPPIDTNYHQDWDDIKNQNNNKIKYYYIRALLGLSESFDFLTDYNKKKITVKLKFDKEKLERFKCPVIFKIIDNNIYLVGNDDIPTIFLHKNSPGFEIAKKDSEKIVPGSEIELPDPIQIPDNFSLSEFVSFCMEHDESGHRKLDNYKMI